MYTCIVYLEIHEAERHHLCIFLFKKKIFSLSERVCVCVLRGRIIELIFVLSFALLSLGSFHSSAHLINIYIWGLLNAIHNVSIDKFQKNHETRQNIETHTRLVRRRFFAVVVGTVFFA